MTDKGFRIFMAITLAVLLVIMSTPLTADNLQDLTSQLMRRISSTEAGPAAAVVVARQ